MHTSLRFLIVIKRWMPAPNSLQFFPINCRWVTLSKGIIIAVGFHNHAPARPPVGEPELSNAASTNASASALP